MAVLLKKATYLVAAGTPTGLVYAMVIEKGPTAPNMIAAPGGAAPGAQPAAPAPDQVYKIDPAPKAPSKGKRGAKVVIEEFSDFQCPFCGRVNPTIKEIVDTYGDKVQIVWRNYPLPFHDKAFKAAEASLEIYAQGGDAKFWAYHDLLFANQRELDRPALEKYAEQVGGINMAKFKTALDNDTHKAAVQADLDAVQKSGARIGTPSFFINGTLLQGAQPFPAFKEKIDAALAGK
jgi:protein-disulfide isomerase